MNAKIVFSPVFFISFSEINAAHLSSVVGVKREEANRFCCLPHWPQSLSVSSLRVMGRGRWCVEGDMS
jgi:hypothetical protein